MKRTDAAALVLSLLAVAASYWVSGRYFERMPHLEDEMAYVWQAQVMARGQIMVPSPPNPKSFLYPFVVDYRGQRFGKYPLGWPALLSLGVRVGLRDLVNPLLAGLGLWLIYCLGKRTFGEVVGLVAGVLTLTSPFFLVNSASLLSHPFGLVLSAAFALAWLKAFGDSRSTRPWLPTLLAALALGMLVLSRPLTAVAVAVPFAIHGLYLLVKGDWSVRRRLSAFIGVVLLLSSLHFAWQYAVTGDPFLNPYTLWWPYDRVGFGPGIGPMPGGNTLHQAWINTRFSLKVGNWDMFGWPMLSFIFIPVGLIALFRYPVKRVEIILLSSVFPCLVIVYLAYWVGASLYGPRYFYEGLYSVVLLSAAGIALLAGWPIRPGQPWPARTQRQRLRSLSVFGVLTALILFNLTFYLPPRLEKMFGLYGVQHAHLEPFLTPAAEKLAPAIFIVHPQNKWIEYGTLLELESPFLDSPFIFIYSRGAAMDQYVVSHFPDRAVYHYYPDQPYTFYQYPRP